MCVFAIVSCGGKSPSDPVTPAEAPKLLSISPVNGATGLTGTTVSVVFTMDQNVYCPTSQRSNITAPSAAIDKIVADKTKVTTTLSGLEAGKTYTLTYPKGTISGYKDNVAEAISTTFTMKEEEKDPVPVDDGNIAWQMMKKLTLGYNLGNQMDAYVNNVADETCWGNPKTTQALFTKLKSYGFTSVRIPITWLGHIGEAPEYTLDKAWLDRVAEIVGYAKTAGLYCIINTHHDECNNDGHWLDVLSASKDSVKKAEITAKLTSLWRQVALRFINEGDYLIFEPFNELQDGGWGWSAAFQANPTAQTMVIDEWNQAFIDTVRATGGNNATRWLCAVGYAASSSLTVQYIKIPKDDANRVMIGFHCYDPYDFCIANKYEQWGHTAQAGKKPSESEEAITKMLGKYYSAFVSKGIPCYMGECGCVHKTTTAGKKCQKYYLEYLTKACRTYGIPAFLWDNGAYGTTGENHGYIKHDNGAFINDCEELVKVMVKGLTNTDNTYTLQTVYNNAPVIN